MTGMRWLAGPGVSPGSPLGWPTIRSSLDNCELAGHRACEPDNGVAEPSRRPAKAICSASRWRRRPYDPGSQVVLAAETHERYVPSSRGLRVPSGTSKLIVAVLLSQAIWQILVS